MQQRAEKLHVFISFIVIAFVAAIQKILAQATLFGVVADQVLALLTSLGLYRILVSGAFFVGNRSPAILAMLWGRDYINGLWTYTYQIGEERRAGIWRVVQSIEGVSISGYGLDRDLKIRSTFRSISPLFKNQGVYEMLALRSIVSEPDRQHVTKTILFFDNYKKGAFNSAPTTIRAQTLIFGGAESGTSHVDVCVTKHNGAVSETEIIFNLRSQLQAKTRSG